MDTVKEFWYINIAKRTERRQRVEARSEAIGLPKLQRFEAVTPWNDHRVTLLKGGRASDQVPGAIGCTLSHYDLWTRSAEIGWRIYIQEDDLIYRKDFVQLVDQYIKDLDKEFGADGWEVLHLNPYLGKIEKDLHNSRIPLTGLTWSLGGYVINPKAAQRCLNYYRFPKSGETVDLNPSGPKLRIPDILISHLFSSKPGISFTTFPYPGIQDKLGTDVQTSTEGLESDHDYYYNQYGGFYKDYYDWTATDEEFDQPLSGLTS